MTNADLQTALQALGLYAGVIDGQIGRQSNAAIDAFLLRKPVENWQRWSAARRLVAAKQQLCKDNGLYNAKVDGVVGPVTNAAFAAWRTRTGTDTSEAGATDISDRGLLALMVREGVALVSYLDTANPPVWTVGVGHTAAAGDPAPRAGFSITLVQALSLFRRDVARYVQDVLRAIKVPLAQHQLDALVSFHYNTGGIFRAALTKAINAGDDTKIRAGFRGWLTPSSIEGRRMSEYRQYVDADYGDISKVLIYTSTNSKHHPTGAKTVSTEGLLS